MLALFLVLAALALVFGLFTTAKFLLLVALALVALALFTRYPGAGA